MEQTIPPVSLLDFQPKTGLTILAGNRVVTIPFADISHISQHRTETVVYTAIRRIPIYQSVDELMKELPVNDFFRVHRNHIVSLQSLGVARVPVARAYKVQIIKKLGEMLNLAYNQ